MQTAFPVLALLLGLSTAGTGALYALASSVQPAELALDALPDAQQGRLVRVKGFVHDSYRSGRGNLFLELAEPASGERGAVFIRTGLLPAATERRLLSGASVEVVGEVETVGGDIAVVPRRAADVRVTGDATSNRVSIASLLRRPDGYAGMTVVVSGTVRSVEAAKEGDRVTARILLEDGGYRLHGTVPGGPGVPDIRGRAWDTGSRITLTGSFEYDERWGEWRVTGGTVEAE